MEPGTSWAWTTDEDTGDGAAELAANLCLGCAGVYQCRAYVETHPEEAGVWAGTTPKDRRGADRENRKST